MGRALRGLGYGLGGLAGLAAAGLGYLYLAFPIMPAPQVGEVEGDLARGSYLAEHVAVCVDCHSERDWSRFSGPVVPGSVGKGGQRFGHEIGLPGEIVVPNITPHHLGSWSDGELKRALTSGVTPDGRALFPLMNYLAFGQLCERDVDALVGYVRSLTPVANETAARRLDFPLDLIVRTMPAPAQLAKKCPDAQDSVALGAYLVRTAGCADCHSQRKGHDIDPERMFAGGVSMKMPNGFTATSKNLTPDASGLGGWSRETFIKRFASYRDPQNLHQVGQGERQSPMPWSMYAGMTDEDLGAIYDFLRTVKPVKTEEPAIAAR